MALWRPGHGREQSAELGRLPDRKEKPLQVTRLFGGLAGWRWQAATGRGRPWKPELDPDKPARCTKGSPGEESSKELWRDAPCGSMVYYTGSHHLPETTVRPSRRSQTNDWMLAAAGRGDQRLTRLGSAPAVVVAGRVRELSGKEPSVRRRRRAAAGRLPGRGRGE